MKSTKHAVALGLLAASIAAGAQPAAGQGMLGRLKDRAKERIEERAGAAIDRAVDGQAAPAPAPQAAAAPSGVGEPAGSPAPRPGEGAWANYDFVPGERILFADDFGRDRVGNFPQRLELRSGNMEVVEWEGDRFLRATAFGTFTIPLPEALPERFTVEFDFSGPSGWSQEVHFTPDNNALTHVSLAPDRGGLDGGGTRSLSEPARDGRNRVVPVRIQVDGRYAKVYIEEKRVGNAPNADLGRSDRIRFAVKASESSQVLIGNIRVAAGGRTLYDAIAAEGRVATQGILFDTGSDRIKPESSPTLREIGQMLREHPDLRIRVEGHTDNVGQAASNQTLSEKRAEAVRHYLVQNHGIDASRLEAKGLGSTRPAAGNDTQEGRQENRRVELVRL
jgi:OmpA-OmpF porin, OOP family